MLRNIQLTNFKCFEELDLSCTSLNLLCGLNGMGKSSIIQALLVLHQSYETKDLLNGRLVLGGERIDLGAGSDVLFDGADNELIGFVLEDDAAESRLELTFDYSRVADQLTARPNGAPGSIEYLPEDWQSMPPFGGHLLYVNAERVGPRKLYPLSDVRGRGGDFGANGEYAWNYLNRHQNDVVDSDDPRSTDTRRRRLLDIVDQWLQNICPGAHLQLEEIAAADAVIAGFSFDRSGDVATSPYRATNVGFGLSYALPVILALLAKPGTLCLIENPEAHLHPRGQTKMAELAARAAVAGVQVFAETHSDHFVDGVRIAVRDRIIAPASTSFHYFDRYVNKAVATSLQVDADGRLSDWPPGFFDQYDENLARLIAPR